MENLYNEFVSKKKEYESAKKKLARVLFKKIYSEKYGSSVVSRKLGLSDSGLRKNISRTGKLKKANDKRLIEIYKAIKSIDKEYELLERSK